MCAGEWPPASKDVCNNKFSRASPSPLDRDRVADGVKVGVGAIIAEGDQTGNTAPAVHVPAPTR